MSAPIVRMESGAEVHVYLFLRRRDCRAGDFLFGVNPAALSALPTDPNVLFRKLVDGHSFLLLALFILDHVGIRPSCLCNIFNLSIQMVFDMGTGSASIIPALRRALSIDPKRFFNVSVLAHVLLPHARCMSLYCGIRFNFLASFCNNSRTTASLSYGSAATLLRPAAFRAAGNEPNLL